MVPKPESTYALSFYQFVKRQKIDATILMCRVAHLEIALGQGSHRARE